MAEVTFAKSFLAALDSRPQKLSADHVEDPKTYPARQPYILPKMPKAMSKRVKLAPGQERSVTVHIKSLRNPPLDIKLSSQPLNTSILDVKTSVAKQTSIPVDKMKILHKKKPAPDSKVLKDLLGDSDTSVEFSVMVLGGAAAVVPGKTNDASATSATSAASASNVAQGTSGEEVLRTDEFWTDLRGFLLQRIRDEKVTEKLLGTFMSSWESDR